MKSTYVWVGETNPYQAQAGRRSSFFRRHTFAAGRDTHYLTQGEAAEKVMAEAENDTGLIREGDTLGEGTHEELTLGALRYHHDGYSWELLNIADVTEREAEVILRDCNGLTDEDKAVIWKQWPDHGPKKYTVTLLRTVYYESTVTVEAMTEEEAKEAAYYKGADWGSPVDEDVTVSEADDAVEEVGPAYAE